MISKEKRSIIELLKEHASDGIILLVPLIIFAGKAVGVVYIAKPKIKL